MKYTLLLSLVLLSIASCVKPPNYNEVPEIEFVSFSETILFQNVDTTKMTFSFTDGDGDLGLQASQTGTNVTVTDMRTGFENYFRIPFIPQQGVGNGISGEITITLFADCCIPDGAPPCQPNPGQAPEELVYSIQIVDQNGNFSNVIQTPALTLRCD